MNQYAKWLIPVAVIAAVVAWFAMRDRPTETVADEPIAEASASSSAPAIQYPLAGANEAAPIPDLDESDADIKSSLERLAGTADLAEVLIPTQIVRRIVVTIDNLPREKIAAQLRPLRDTPGAFIVSGNTEAPVTSSDNYVRYARFMHIVRVADMAQVADWYRRHYSLFQQAYAGLGYPQGYFNDRLVQCIDNLLATPELDGPLQLVQPKVFYEFADPALEARSAGQKTLLRMGPDNSRLIKQKLRELRAEITKPLPQ